ncbi:MAG: virulence RhuM family protein [Planctomycetes bacterium]|nr:virulence RhuM family protein [Planctomycetota bacterium]
MFGRDNPVISRHLRNVFQEGEWEREATVAKNATVQTEGGRKVTRQVDYYNLDAIISVGYRCSDCDKFFGFVIKRIITFLFVCSCSVISTTSV